MRKSKKLLLLVLMLMTTIALGGCSGDKANESSKDTITIGIPQDLEDGLDPHVVSAAGTNEILFNIYEGLVKYDSNGNLYDAIAASHEISDDGLTYTFTIRDGVKFHDGSLLTADDVVYSLNRCAGAETGQPLVSAFSVVDSIEKISENQVVIKLNTPDNDFLAYLTAAILKSDNTDPNTSVVGTGPYKWISRVPQESITLEAFDDYYGEKAHIKNIILKIRANADTIVMDLKGGSIDMYARIPAAQVAELQGDEFTIEEGTMNLVQGLFLNNAVEPFDDVRVRQALCYALDPQEVMTFVSDGKGSEIGSCMFPAFAKYYDSSLNDKYNQDIEKAKGLLKDAGYPDGFSFEITVPSNYQQHVDTAQVLVEQFKKIGVTASIKSVEWDTWLSETYVGRNYQATVIGLDASELTASSLLDRYVSDRDNNFVNFKSADYDEEYNLAKSTVDDEEQTQHYKKCLEILADEAASVYIEDLPTFVAIRSNIGGYEFYPLYVQDFSKLYIK